MLQKVEKRIVNKLVNEAIKAGYFLTVFDGEEHPVSNSQDIDLIEKNMFTTDEEVLYFSRPGTDRGDFIRTGQVLLVYGNGADVIADYSESLDPVLSKLIDDTSL